ncbi:adenylyltransferase/cytidyltransferase family protein [Nitrococcus mobilis]|uniref:TagD protein n=1 Tax=Nitrococcus mobilis Nb-231 TaxID=314278 RepID=A4BT85_9GAMM|nr:adenylyltransferase/cytidyltransferase family protein [Nitrococcus mobilis]EAR21153.1 TagD protein [Nitrococcus mobilis Nb-231]
MGKGKIVITYGTFDLFHIGHLRLFERAKEYGDKLIVAVSTDEFNSVKGKKVLIPYEQRAEIVKSIRCVDIVIPEMSWEQKVEDVNKHHVDTLIMGKDWEGQFDELKRFCEVVYLDRTQDISTTRLKSSLKKLVSVSPDEFKAALSVLEQLQKDLE